MCWYKTTQKGGLNIIHTDKLTHAVHNTPTSLHAYKQTVMRGNCVFLDLWYLFCRPFRGCPLTSVIDRGMNECL